MKPLIPALILPLLLTPAALAQIRVDPPPCARSKEGLVRATKQGLEIVDPNHSVQVCKRFILDIVWGAGYGDRNGCLQVSDIDPILLSELGIPLREVQNTMRSAAPNACWEFPED